MPGEQIDRLNRRPHRARRRAWLTCDPALELNQRGRLGTNRPRGQSQPTSRGRDRGERLTAEPVAVKPSQILHRLKLGGRVPAKGERNLLCGNARSVIVHRNSFTTGPGDLHRDPPRVRVQGVLQQLLEHRGGAFDHLARRNLSGDPLGQLTDRRRR